MSSIALHVLVSSIAMQVSVSSIAMQVLVISISMHVLVSSISMHVSVSSTGCNAGVWVQHCIIDAVTCRPMRVFRNENLLLTVCSLVRLMFQWMCSKYTSPADTCSPQK